MSAKKPFRPETQAIHSGQQLDPATFSRAVPIYQTSSFGFKDTEHAASLFNLSEQGYIYTRIVNPTTDVFEQRIAELEGGVGALGVASGQSATTFSILNIASAGDEIVSASSLYGGTYNLFSSTLPKLGITVKFVNADNPENFRSAITSKTKAIYAESVGNPQGNVLDIEAVADIAHEHGIPLIIDNTVPSPYLLRPIDFGADIVVHSATKFLGGHGTAIGAVLSPFNSFLLLQGVETLHLRLERHSENALKVAKFLEQHELVEWVNYAGLPSHPSYSLAQKYLPKGQGAILTFGVRGGKNAAAKLIDSVQLFSHLANIGDSKSLIIHPASTTHQQLSKDEQKASGVTPELIRLSVGTEAIDDLLEDLDYALKASQKVNTTV